MRHVVIFELVEIDVADCEGDFAFLAAAESLVFVCVLVLLQGFRIETLLLKVARLVDVVPRLLNQTLVIEDNGGKYHDAKDDPEQVEW